MDTANSFKMAGLIKLTFFFILTLIYVETYGFSGEMLSYSDPTNCADDEYFDVQFVKCISCNKLNNLEPTKDKLSCTCNSQSKIVRMNEGNFPECMLCPENEVPTSDKLDCLPCSSKPAQENETIICEVCGADKIKVEREYNGSLSKAVHCLACAAGTVPSSDQRFCIPCMQNTSKENSVNCSCPSSTHELIEGICVPLSSLSNWPDDGNNYIVEFESGRKLDSFFIRRYLRLSVYLCKLKNQTACQMVANMCTLVMYRDDYVGSPCKLFQDSKHIPTSDGNKLPWLYYGEGDAQTLLSRKKITAKYSLDPHAKASTLNLTVIRFSPEGLTKGISSAKGSFLQLCPRSWTSLDTGLRFGSWYHHRCLMPVSQLIQLRDTEFLDLYLQYWDGTDSFLYPVPVLMLDVKVGGKFVNKASDSSQWQLTRRFFLIDKISGIKSLTDKVMPKRKAEDTPSVIRYLKSCTLRVKVQGHEEGRIYPPLLVLKYGEISQEDIEADIEVPLTFSVEYKMENTMSHAIEVSVGVLSALAVVWSGIETWSYSRRSGRVGIDLITLGHLILFSCGNLANVFFFVVGCASFHNFAFYKGQSVVQVLLPSHKQEDLIRSYIISAFSLKIVEVIHLIWKQISVDIFFIDWERPRARSSVIKPSNQPMITDNSEQLVSIWRTYFVANEWNEIQTTRKISLLFQLILTVFILKVIGLEYWAVANPELHSSAPEYMETNPQNMIFRFSVGITVYLSIYFLQWLFMVSIYERYVKNVIHEFVDICSMANISVFILAQENYGFYIHGRSAHGFADTDMQTMLGQLQREEEDLCGHRGLLPGTDQQTFQMAIPLQLRAYYRKVMTPISSPSWAKVISSHNHSHSHPAQDNKILKNRHSASEEDLDKTVETRKAITKYDTARTRKPQPRFSHVVYQNSKLSELSFSGPSFLPVHFQKLCMIEISCSEIMQSTKRLSMAGAGGLRTKMLTGNMDRSIQAYHNMNKFLSAFLEHALKDLDYDVREKTFVESLLDMEFTEIFDKGVFYADNGHSFDKVLFYGNECTLATFDIFLFSFVEILFHDFLLAAIITAFFAKMLIMIRRVGGRNNLAKKTLIDDRFLV